jgi:hypothetical protein
MSQKVDPTVAGLFLVGFITLFFGLLGIQIFQSGDMELFGVALKFIGIIGLLMVLFAFMAGKAGNAYATALFAFVAVALFGVGFGFNPSETVTVVGEKVVTVAAYSFPVVFYAIAVFFFLFAVVGFAIGAPKLMGLLLLFVAGLYLFVGLAIGPGDAPYSFMFGAFGLLSSFVATYMAIGLGTQKLPVF